MKVKYPNEGECDHHQGRWVDLARTRRTIRGMKRAFPALLAPSLVLSSFCLLASAATADTCPANKDIAAAETEIFGQIKLAARGDLVAPLSDALWQLWTDAPDARAQKLLDDGMRALRLGDYGFAEQTLDALIAYCPDYAEGYNQRAFAEYLQFNYSAAIPLLDRAEALSPRHLGVLTGKALTFVAMGDVQAAQEPLIKAVRLNPWLSERALLLEPLGQEL